MQKKISTRETNLEQSRIENDVGFVLKQRDRGADDSVEWFESWFDGIGASGAGHSGDRHLNPPRSAVDFVVGVQEPHVLELIGVAGEGSQLQASDSRRHQVRERIEEEKNLE